MPGRGTPLVGRERELSLLRAFLDDAAGRTPLSNALVIVGDAGVGKTALAEAASHHAAERGMRLLRASGVQFEAEVGFASLHQLLSPLLADRARLPAAHRRALGVALGVDQGLPDRLALVDAVIALVAGSDSSPVLVVIDDAQWLDRASAAVLAAVARRLTGTAIRLLAVVRSEEDSVFDDAGLDEVLVGPLDETASASLVASAFPGLAPREVRAVLAEAQGNPLALIELPSGEAAAEPSSARTSVGRRLRLAFERRIDALPAPTREQLLQAALDGSGDLFPAPARFGLEPAERARLVRIHPVTRSAEFRHPLIRSTVVELATDDERRSAHRALADRHPAGSERRAWHLASAAPAPDEEIARLLEDSAMRSKTRGDPVGAISLLLRSAELSPAHDDSHRRAMFATYLGADVTGDLVNPQLPALPLDGRSHTVATAVAAAAYMVNIGGDADTIHRILLDALRTVPKPVTTWDEPLAEIVYVLMANGSFGSRADLVAGYWQAIDELGLEPPQSLQLMGHTFLEPAPHAREWLPVLDEAIAAIDDEFDTAQAARLGIASMYVDRLQACRPALWRVIDHGRAGGAVASAIKAFALLGFDGVLTGDWDGALRIADEGLEYTDRHHYRLLGGFLKYSQAMIAAARGDEGTARGIAADLASWGAPNRIGFVMQLSAHVNALADLTRGDFDAGYGHLREVCSPETVPSYKPAALWMLFDLVEAAVRAGRMDEATAHTADIRASGVADLSPRLALVAAGAEALVAAPDDMASAFERALALPGANGWPFLHARIRLAYGERLRRLKSRSESRRQLTAAADLFESLGATPWAARARSELRAAGWVAETPSAQVLTPQEQEIAELAATGLTNKQIAERLFLSPRTVAAHLYHAFPKLGVTSRAGLRDALAPQHS